MNAIPIAAYAPFHVHALILSTANGWKIVPARPEKAIIKLRTRPKRFSNQFERRTVGARSSGIV